MGLRFRKSFKLMPGVRINLSSKGLSTTIGGRGASVNVSSRGTYLNAGIPGTGISSRQRIGGGSAAARPTPGAPGGGAPSKNPFKTILLLGGGFLALVWLGAQKTTPTPAAAPARVHFAHPLAVLADGVNVREDPTPTGRVVATVSKTDSVEYFNSIGGTWASVMLRDGKPGFIATKFLKGLAPPVVAYKFRKARRSPLTAHRAHHTGQVAALAPAPVATRSELPALPTAVAPISLSPGEESALSSSSSASSYGTGSYGGGYSGGSHTIFTGPRGGHYYINSHGNKSYVRSRR